MNYKLMRTRYTTDADEADPDYIGWFSSEFPDPKARDAQIVNVDWSERGFVWVTYLTPAY